MKSKALIHAFGVALLALTPTITFAQSSAVPPKPAKPAKPPRNGYLRAAPSLVAAGDLTGDGRDEVVAWDADARKLAVFDCTSGTARELTSQAIDGQPTSLAVLDVDGDGKGEVILGEGLPSTDATDVMKTEVRLRLYRPLSSAGWAPEDMFRGPTSRPEITNLQIVDLAGNGQRRLLFRYFASKYEVTLGVAQRTPAGWQVESPGTTRMGTTVTAGRIDGSRESHLIIGRPYGEPQGKEQTTGDAFILTGNGREALPVKGGVSTVAYAHVRDAKLPDIVVGDGWNSDFGRKARARIAIMRRAGGTWDYELIEDLPGFIRIIELLPVDLDGDGLDEVLALAEETTTEAPCLRLYQQKAGAWRGSTLSIGTGAFAVASFTGDKRRSLVLAGPGAPPRVQPLDPAQIAWDAQLAPERAVTIQDPNALIGKMLPRLAFTAVDGRKVDLEQMRGKVVLVDFWATWCGPCIAELPNVKRVYAAYHDKGFEVVGISLENPRISTQDTPEQAAAKLDKARKVLLAFAAKNDLPWPQYFDGKWWKNEISAPYGINAIPAMFLVDQEGRLVSTAARGQALEQEVKRLLKL